MRRYHVLTIAMLIAASATVLGAQAMTTPGTRVRVVRTPGTHVLQVGVLERLTSDSVAVRDAQGSVRVLPLGGTMRLDVSRGRQRRILPGMLIGGAAGAVGGALVGLALDQSADREAEALCAPNCINSDRFLNGIEIALGAAFGTGLGVVVGGIVGANPHERWHPATLPGGATLSLAPHGRYAVLRIPLGQQRR